MKKFDLLKILGITFLVVLLISWVVPAGVISSGAFTSLESTVTIGLYDIVRTPAITIATFIQYGLLFLAIGGFYGVLNKTGVYSKLVDKLVTRWKKDRNKFLIITIVAFALLTSIIGLPNVIVILVPFFVAVLLSLGYSKLTSFAATIGSILIGQIGTTFGFSIWGFLKIVFDLEMTTLLLVRFILLVMVIVLFVTLVIKKSKTEIEKIEEPKTKKGKKTVEEKKEDSKVEIPLFEKKESKKGYMPLVIISIIMLVLLVLGLYNWYYAFNIETFTNLNEAITGYEFNGYPLFANLLGSTSEIGFWGNYDLIVILVVAAFVIGWIYSVKFDEMIEGFKNGAKEMFPTALFAMLASVIFTSFLNMSDGNFINTIVNQFISGSENFSLLGTIGSGLVSSFAFNDFYTLLNNLYSLFVVYDATVLPIVAFLFQTMYGIVMVIAPTSIYLLAGLAYLQIPYKEWVKYIWKFLLIVFAIVVVIAFILTTLI